METVISRIKEINEDPYYLYYIDKAVLFGSYINSYKDILGDIDIAIYISPKMEIEELLKISRKRAFEHGIRDIIISLGYAKEEVFRYIKNRKASVSLHDGLDADYESKANNEAESYIYLDKHEVLYVREENNPN